MKRPTGFLAVPPEKRRNTSFNLTFSVHPDELAEAAHQLGMLAPDGSEVTWKLNAELRFRREADGERLAVQVHFTVAAVEEGKR